MTSRDFFRKLFSRWVWVNILAMALVVIALITGVKYGLNAYTHHGEAILVPNFRGMNIEEARKLMNSYGVNIEVSDSGRNKTLPADCILLQNPVGGSHVKSGRTVYVTINSLSSPMVAIPDIIDNSSLREAESKLRSLGFTLLSPKYVEGEKDWIYGIICRGKNLSTGEKVATDVPIALVVGSGAYEDDEQLDFVGADGGDTPGSQDDFEIVTEPEDGLPGSTVNIAE